MRFPVQIHQLGLLLAVTALVALLLGAGADGAAAKRRAAGLQIGVHQHRVVGGTKTIRRCSARASGLAARARRRGKRAKISSASRCGTSSKYQAGPGSIYWGAWMGRQLTGNEAPWDMHAVEKFEGMAGKKMSIVQFGSPFANCAEECYFYNFPTEPMQKVREHGSIPFLSWSSQSIPTHTEEPDYQLSDVAEGDYDSYIKRFAKDAAAWGHPFFLRFDWEMNGNWFPWNAGANGNNAAEYVAAWRHVHDIFAAAGATNATWVWCPNVDPGDDFVGLKSLYPGDSYVDWTCLDGYNWGTGPHSPNKWIGFDQLFRSTYNEITQEIAPEKPMIIGETSSSEIGGSKADWITEALTKIPTQYPQIRGLLWFERYDNEMDWPIETSSSATSAFSNGIQQAAFGTNSYASLDTSGPIQPPAG
jgi:Glycosyl hydrolase family 26